MLPCGFGAYALGHALHRFAAPGELAGLAVVVLACSAPFVATRLADALAERFDEGVVAPIRGSWERCLLTGAGASPPRIFRRASSPSRSSRRPTSSSRSAMPCGPNTRAGSCAEGPGGAPRAPARE